MKNIRAFRPLAAIALATIALPGMSGGGLAHAATKSVGTASFSHVTSLGTTSLKGGSTTGSFIESSADTTGADNSQTKENVPKFPLAAGVSVSVPTPASSGTATSDTSNSFSGLNHQDQRLSDLQNGFTRQYSTEPPDQGLCVGGGFLVETVNSAVGVYSDPTNAQDTHATKPAPVALQSLNRFFNLPSALSRDSQGNAIPPFGPSLGDPRCLYDGSTGHFFLSAFKQDVDPNTGATLPNSSVYFAVSQTNDPTGNWSIFAINVTDATGTPDHQGCPCFGDFPAIGFDANGFYVTTNEFSLQNKQGFNGAQVYAMSKSALEAVAVSGSTSTNTPTVVHFSNLSIDHPAFADSLQPSMSPNGTFETANNGTEYFVSSLDFRGKLDNRIAVWALTNTASLNDATPSVTLTNNVVTAEPYGIPPAAQQESGPLPLSNFIFKQTNKIQNSLALIDGGDDRISATVVFDGTTLWSALTTVVNDATGTHSGIAYFLLQPSWSSSALATSVTQQGYVALTGANLTYPSVGVNTVSKKGVLGYSIVSSNQFPSTGYSRVDATNGAGTVHVAGIGKAPEDGFTGYNEPNHATADHSSGVSRWGDYTATATDPDGTIWTAAEYIPFACTTLGGDCNGLRTFQANWGTFVSQVQP